MIQTARDHIVSGESHTYHFISPILYDELDSLCIRARSSYDLKEFFELQHKTGPMPIWWREWKTQIGASDEETRSILSNCYFELFPNTRE